MSTSSATLWPVPRALGLGPWARRPRLLAPLGVPMRGCLRRRAERGGRHLGQAVGGDHAVVAHADLMGKRRSKRLHTRPVRRGPHLRDHRGGVPESSRNAAAASVGRPSATSFSKACEFGSGPVGDRGLVDDQSPDRHGSGCRLERERPSRGLAEHECRLAPPFRSLRLDPPPPSRSRTEEVLPLLPRPRLSYS
jgi:hypothetical protein